MTCCLQRFNFERKLQKCIGMGITILKIFILGRYIVGYSFGSHVLRLRSRVAVKLNFRPYIRRYTSPNENFEYSYLLNDMIQPILLQYLEHGKYADLCSLHQSHSHLHTLRSLSKEVAEGYGQGQNLDLANHKLHAHS